MHKRATQQKLHTDSKVGVIKLFYSESFGNSKYGIPLSHEINKWKTSDVEALRSSDLKSYRGGVDASPLVFLYGCYLLLSIGVGFSLF